jgi:hypothetical protein
MMQLIDTKTAECMFQSEISKLKPLMKWWSLQKKFISRAGGYARNAGGRETVLKAV